MHTAAFFNTPKDPSSYHFSLDGASPGRGVHGIYGVHGVRILVMIPRRIAPTQKFDSSNKITESPTLYHCDQMRVS
jgi:hypothetical protein